MGEEDSFSTRTKFFKILFPGFQQRLKLPPAFCKKVKHEKSKRAILETNKGKWEINVCREDDDHIVLENGWPRFADEHGLSLRDFLVFEHIGKLHFNVVVCDSSGNEKQFLVEPDNNEHQTINPSSHSNKKSPNFSQRPSFSVELTNFTTTNKKGRVYIPAEFVSSNHLGQKKGAILKDPRRGRKWRVKLYVQKSPAFRVVMTTGWPKFAKANKLKVGDVCTFQLNPPKSPTSRNISFDVSISRNTSC